MVWCRTQIHGLSTRNLSTLALLALVAVFAAGYAAAAGSGQAKSEARLRELMTQRYELFKRAVQNSELLLKAGRTTYLTHQSLLEPLYRAQADLATTAAERVQIYEKMVEALLANVALAERQGNAGRLSGDELMRVELAALNAQIDLERLRLGQPIPQR